MGLFDVIGDIAKAVAPFTGPYMPIVAGIGELADGIDPGDGDRGSIISAFTSEDDTQAGGTGIAGLAGMFGVSGGTASAIGAAASVIGSDDENRTDAIINVASEYLKGSGGAAIQPS